MDKKLDLINKSNETLCTQSAQELAHTLQAWFDKWQPLAERDFGKLVDHFAHNPRANARQHGHIVAHAVDWFYYGN